MKRTFAILVCLPVLMFLLLTGCGDPERNDFEAAREKWKALSPAHYTVEASTFCECIMGQFHWVEVEVRDGQPVAYRDIETGHDLLMDDGSEATVISEFPDAWPAVDEYFSLIESAWERGETVKAEYDSLQGYPHYISIKGDPEIPDDQISYQLRSLRILP